MPILLKIDHDPDIELSIWKNMESDQYFLDKLDIHQGEQEIIATLKNRKKREWLSSRYLLHLMSGRATRGEFTKDVHGKPHLLDSEYHVSISHTKDYVSVIASPKIVGVDIQTYVSKISRIKHKFVSDTESRFITPENETEVLHIIWGAKESLYKAYGKRALDFINHIFISGLENITKSGYFQGIVEKDDYRKEFELFYHLYKDYILVYAKESS